MFRKWFASAKPPPYDARVSSKALDANRAKFHTMCVNGNPLTTMWSLLWQTPGAEQLPEATNFAVVCSATQYCYISATFTFSGRNVTLYIDRDGTLRVEAHVTLTDGTLGPQKFEAKWTGSDLATAVQVLIQHLRS